MLRVIDVSSSGTSNIVRYFFETSPSRIYYFIVRLGVVPPTSIAGWTNMLNSSCFKSEADTLELREDT